MAEGSQTPEEEKYIPPATERTTNATPLSEWGDKKPQFRGAIPQEKYTSMNRREFIKKSAIGLGGVLAAAAGMIGLRETFKKAGEQFRKT